MNLTFNQILILIIVTSLLGFYFKQKENNKIIHYENFTNYTLKDSLISIYDNFYSQLYNKLFNSDIKNEFEIYNIVNYTIKENKTFDKHDVNILDIGCGTGNHLKILSRHKYNCVGIDKSIKKLKIARNVNPEVPLIKGDYHNKSSFKKNEFTHVFCFFFTLYYSQYPDRVFNNVNYWLKPGGFFCVHLVNKKKFDPVLEKASRLIPLFNPQKHTHERVTKTKLKFNKFNYISDWVFGNNKVEFIENFMFDDESKHIQNKHIMYMKGIKYYKKLAIDNGFELIKIIDLLPVNHDDNYIYIFKKKYGE